MWQTDIAQQEIEVEGRRFKAADRMALCTLARTEADVALRDVYAFLSDWFSAEPCMEVQTSGSTSEPQRMRVEKVRMMHSACMTCRTLALRRGETALLCMDLKYIGAKMMVVRALVAGLRLLVCRASGHPLAGVEERVDFLSVVPLQLYRTLQVAEERERLSRVRCVIVGGGAVDEALQKELQALPCRVYSTYGMTETLSHVALRPLNGPEASERYRPLEGVRLSQAADGALVVHAPELCAAPLLTHDVVRLFADGSFMVCGRTDNVVNSGGVKIQIEEDEARLRAVIPGRIALTAVPDARLGEALVLLVEEALSWSDEALRHRMLGCLPRYHVPRHILRVERIPETGNGKTDRRKCRQLAAWFVAER